MKIFIYSIERPSAFGIQDWVNDASGKKLKKTKIGRCRDRRQALYNPKYGGLATGLHLPWMENGVQVVDTDGRPATLQQKMERKWRLDPGYLTNKPPMKGDSLKDSDRTYFQRKSWTLNDGCTVLDLENFDDEMFYYVCLAGSFCANSEKEYREHKAPKAQYYIALENESEELKYSKNQRKSKAFADMYKESMTPTIKEKIIVILELAGAFSTLTQEQVHNLLYEYIDKTTFAPNSNIEKFEGLVSQLDTPTGREEIEAKYLLRQAVDSRVIYEKQGAYKWARPTGEIILGETYSETIDFLSSPKKDAIIQDLKEEIKLKNR